MAMRDGLDAAKIEEAGATAVLKIDESGFAS